MSSAASEICASASIGRETLGGCGSLVSREGGAGFFVEVLSSGEWALDVEDGLLGLSRGSRRRCEGIVDREWVAQSLEERGFRCGASRRFPFWEFVSRHNARILGKEERITGALQKEKQDRTE